jgi:hypothetical protein
MCESTLLIPSITFCAVYVSTLKYDTISQATHPDHCYVFLTVQEGPHLHPDRNHLTFHMRSLRSLRGNGCQGLLAPEMIFSTKEGVVACITTQTSVFICTPTVLNILAITWCKNKYMSEGFQTSGFSTTYRLLKTIQLMVHALQGQVARLLERMYDLEMQRISLWLWNRF